MPCRDYEYDGSGSDAAEIRELERQNDRLARVACAAMTELERQGTAELVLLQNEELRQWWEAHKIADAKAMAEAKAKAEAAAEKRRLAKVKKEVLAKLSADERKALGIK